MKNELSSIPAKDLPTQSLLDLVHRHRRIDYQIAVLRQFRDACLNWMTINPVKVFNSHTRPLPLPATPKPFVTARIQVDSESYGRFPLNRRQNLEMSHSVKNHRAVGTYAKMRQCAVNHSRCSQRFVQGVTSILH